MAAMVVIEYLGVKAFITIIRKLKQFLQCKKEPKEPKEPKELNEHKVSTQNYVYTLEKERG